MWEVRGVIMGDLREWIRVKWKIFIDTIVYIFTDLKKDFNGVRRQQKAVIDTHPPPSLSSFFPQKTLKQGFDPPKHFPFLPSPSK